MRSLLIVRIISILIFCWYLSNTHVLCGSTMSSCKHVFNAENDYKQLLRPSERIFRVCKTMRF